MSSQAYPDVTVLLPDPSLPDRTKVGGVFSAEDLDAIERAHRALAELESYRFDFFDDHDNLLDRLVRRPPAFVLNLCDTGLRNVAEHELHVPALLEVFGVPYTGCPPACLAVCYDKAVVHAVASDCGIPVPVQRFLADDEVPEAWDFFPALVKPARADGGLGITQHSIAAVPRELEECVARIRAELPGRGLLIQEFLEGDEYGVGLVGNPGAFTALPALEVDWGRLPEELPRILGYESKTLPTSPYWTELRYRPAALESEEEASLSGHARMLFDRLGCRDYARFDFRRGRDGVIRLLEVNPNPAWCWDGKLNMMAGHAGISYAGLLSLILDAAWRRLSH